MAKSSDISRLIVFAKAPIAGEVKTRLSPFLSAENAAQLHRRLVLHTLKTASLLEHCQVELWVGSDHVWWDQLAGQYAITLHKQCGMDLGERMLSAFDDVLSRSDKAVIMGTDCPWITPHYVQSAFDSLDQNSAVIGPAKDGGYVLLGLKRPMPALFQTMPWGGETVFAETVSRLQGVAWCELEPLRDIDRPEDVMVLKKSLPALTVDLDRD
ncbi:TIGR04282 family arsenosugar biosynthesis glycosyltransferase [Oceanicoccus sagamiensis]|uniref:Glycosyltransferase n=1 Tax=Oceanicoccus sagamiensis TaxID=716816 RepID=A0A1X9NC02_9GAMM|nr:TIGR04282 family arsenosugar biosynthesis glycosyltransferase [Oceanicoccus sagamiensis]ARN73069.1 hypothetical protein BST96_02470 [Oceanicoccus sagamiensis]